MYFHCSSSRICVLLYSLKSFLCLISSPQFYYFISLISQIIFLIYSHIFFLLEAVEEKKIEEKNSSGEKDYIVPGGDEKIGKNKIKNNEKMRNKEKKEEENDDDYDSDEIGGDEDGEGEGEDNDVDDAYDEDDYGEEEENEKTMNKFNLKSFSKQPIVQLSEGISVNLFLSNIENNKNENEIFDAEKFGKDFLNERKKLANEEIEKLAKEIKELDDELDEDEVEKKLVLEKEIDDKSKILTSESTKLVEMSENEILVKKRKEIQKRNNKNIEEREAIVNFLLFSVLNEEISIQMKIKNGNGNQKDGFVTISVRQEKNEDSDDNDGKNENEEKDEKRQDILVKYDNGVEQKQMKKTDKDKDKRDDLITIVFKATDRLEPIIITREMKNKEKGRDENDEDNNEIMNNNNNSKSKNNYFVLAEKVLGSSLVTAFEVRNSSIELN